MLELCESPIEVLFMDALLRRIPDSQSDISIDPQVQIGPYRVDVLIRVPNVPFPHINGLVVELDGHDFHERTKEQAERDRRRDRQLAMWGYPTIRFTGREVHRDPAACVEEVCKHLYQALEIAEAT